MQMTGNLRWTDRKQKTQILQEYLNPGKMLAYQKKKTHTPRWWIPTLNEVLNLCLSGFKSKEETQDCQHSKLHDVYNKMI